MLDENAPTPFGRQQRFLARQRPKSQSAFSLTEMT
jgi:hypothetical protein